MLTPEYDVVAIGNAIMDIFAKVSDDFIARMAEDYGMVAGAMNLVDADQAAEIYARMKDPAIKPGGAACNMAAGFRSFGGTCAFIGKVGNDRFGVQFAAGLRDAGIYYDTPPHESAAGAATARSLILIAPDGSRSMNTHLGSTRTLCEGDIDGDVVAAGRYLYLEGYLLDAPLAKKALLYAAGIARDAGRKVALNLSDVNLVSRNRDDLLEMVKGNIDILFANEKEAKALFGVRTLNEAISAARDSCEITAITRSAKGSVAVSGENVAEIAGRPAQVVDATGASDQYAAGFLTGLNRGVSLYACGRLGAAAAGDVLTHIGGQPQGNYAALIIRELVGTLAKT